MSEGLDVGIVAYRCREMLEACLASLRDHPPLRPMHVWVVDNDSHDGTVEMARSAPGVEVIALSENAGFAAATNRAIERSHNPYFLALNPDTRMRPGVLDTLLRLMDDDPTIGICGCRLERENGTFDHAARRSFPTVVGALAHFGGVGRHRGAPPALSQYRAPEVTRGPVDAVSGAFMLIRRRVLDEIGLFDEGYWMYMEDLDLCYRAAGAGWVTWYEPSVTVTHVKGGASGRHRRLRVNRAFHYGMYRFYHRYYAPARAHPVNLAVYSGIAIRFALTATWSAVNRRVLGRAIGSIARRG
jgi:N-acetylglucosaminyl-diphospho-decaprenol L-rhamnosyltransferase